MYKENETMDGTSDDKSKEEQSRLDNDVNQSQAGNGFHEANEYGEEDVVNEDAMKNDENASEEDIPYGEALKFRVPVGIIVFLVTVIALDLICMIRFPKVLADYKIFALAEERIDNGETSLAINELYDLAEKHQKSVPIMVKLVDLSMENGYYDMAGYAIDTYLVGKSISDSEYNRIDGYYEKLENYYATYDAIEKIVSSMTDQDTSDETYYDNIKTQLLSLLQEEGQDYAYVYYYLGLVEEDKVAARDYLLLSYENDPNCFDARAQLSIMSRRLGDIEGAKQYALEALDMDKQDTTALRAMATIALVEGDLEKGLQYAEDAYNIYPDGGYIRDTYAIALYANGREEDSKRITDEITASGLTLEEDTIQFLNGEMTLEEYYIGE